MLLELRNIEVHYGGVKALNGANIKIDEGEIVALMGPNGAGKSTILKAIFGLAPIESGKVIWEGGEIKLKPFEIVELGISFVPQGRRVFKHLSVYENIEIGGHAIKNKAVLKERIKEVLDIFPALKEKLNQKSGQLSGGQQQMVALARGLVTDPKLKEINERKGTAIIVVEHNIKSLLEIADRAYVLDKGKVVSEGAGKDFIHSDILEKVFMGRV